MEVNQNELNPANISIGVVGLGLMGCSICACFLIAGHKVVAIAPIPSDMNTALERIKNHLTKAYTKEMIPYPAEYYLGDITISEEYTLLSTCKIVLECTLENIEIKKAVYEKIVPVVSNQCIICSNTSAIPITSLQSMVPHPERFVGLHWAEPSHTTRFLEIICGNDTDISKAEWLYTLSHAWGKEPTLVRKDIRGFIANRLMYAMYREAFYLVENGYATIEDVDRACRNNTGYFMTLMGVFRWMDMTGVPAYHTVMKDLNPTLNNQASIPSLIDNIVQRGGKGILNGDGFYDYTPEEIKLWEETFSEFTYEIRNLALKYPGDVVEKKKTKGSI
ncbi:MAG: 3-hydroxyacyl-CoA dehydrogenase family protein [Saprospiraceae bacterium]|nr:3-hydroxyacyl-CoA dehydrogenase family protein [Saprospiraceae bacterium]